MPKSSVTSMHAARCMQSHILYRCNLQRANSPNIHLGVLIELVGDGWHGFGAAIRRNLDEAQIAALAPAWKDRLRSPFNYFATELDAAWSEADRGACIEWLAREYNGSLLVEPAQAIDHQRITTPTSDGADDLELAVRERVFQMLELEARRFLDSSKKRDFAIEADPGAEAA